MPSEFFIKSGRAIAKARKAKGYKQNVFAKKIKVKPSTYSGYERGASRVPPDLRVILKNELDLTDKDFESDEPDESLVVGPTSAIAGPRRVPVVKWARSELLFERGQTFGDLDEQSEDMIETDSADPQAIGLIIEGDSMEPKFEAGDRVVISPGEIPRNGNYVLAILQTGQIFFRRFKRTGPNGTIIQLESINPEYETIERQESEFRFIYPAVGVHRKLRI